MTSGENLCSTTCPLLSELPPVQYIHLTSSSLSESQMSFCQQLIISYLQQAPGHCCDWLSGLDISLVTGELPVVYQGSKVSAKTPSTLICVSIETTTGKAGRMLMASQRACDTQQQPFVTEKPSRMNPSLITVSTEWNTRSDATLVSTHALWNHFSLKKLQKGQHYGQQMHAYIYSRFLPKYMSPATFHHCRGLVSSKPLRLSGRYLAWAHDAERVYICYSNNQMFCIIHGLLKNIWRY